MPPVSAATSHLVKSAVFGAAAVAALAAAPASAGSGDKLSGFPEIIDGDTIALEGRTLRLYGIDAPELGQTCSIKGRPYDCGIVSRTALMDLTAGTPVVCRLVENPDDARDMAPDTATARCTAGGYDLSEGMTYTGWALAQRALTARYLSFERDAKDKVRGLWKGAFVTPWDWRGGSRLAETKTTHN